MPVIRPERHAVAIRDLKVDFMFVSRSLGFDKFRTELKIRGKEGKLRVPMDSHGKKRAIPHLVPIVRKAVAFWQIGNHKMLVAV